MHQEQEFVPSPRIKNLAKKIEKKEYRDGYVSSHLKTFLANQIQSLRAGRSQEEFGKLLDKPQSVISRLEDPSYGKVTVQTLLDIASKIDVALVVRFVDYPTFIKLTDDFSDKALCPPGYDQNEMEVLINSTVIPQGGIATATCAGNVIAMTSAAAVYKTDASYKSTSPHSENIFDISHLYCASSAGYTQPTGSSALMANLANTLEGLR